MHMCMLRTLLRIQHACALEYDKPWLIQHYIKIFNMLVFSGSSDYVAVAAATFSQIFENFGTLLLFLSTLGLFGFLKYVFPLL